MAKRSAAEQARVNGWLERGRVAFNAGAFFEAHEHWEDAWRELTGRERTAVQGLIQVAAALHHLQNGRPRPAAALLTKAAGKLDGDVPALAGFRVGALATEVERLLAQLRGAPADLPVVPTPQL